MTCLTSVLPLGGALVPTRPLRSGIHSSTPRRRLSALAPLKPHLVAEPESVQHAAPAAAAPPPPPPRDATPSAPRQPLFGDALLESTRPQLRTVFDADRWVMHRSVNRYFRHLWDLPRSRLLLGLAAPLAYVLGLSAVVCAYGAAQQAGLLPSLLPSLAGAARMRELYNLTSPTLALLLVFRTNASYARWDEGRKMWGMVLNRTRNICRLGLAWIGDDKRELRSMLEELEGILLPHEIEGVLRASHRPNYVLQVLAQIVRTAGLPTAATLRMEDDLTNFGDSLGGCERLLRTPIPLFYTRHTSRFLMIWLTFLPATLWPACGLLTLPLVFLISFLLLGVDKIGVSIEEPFSILELETIASRALENVHELAAMHDGVADIPLGGGSSSSSSSNRASSNRGAGTGRLHPSFGVYSSSNGSSGANGSGGHHGSGLIGHVSSIVSAATMVSLARPATA
ncbi:hypothetical protein C2E20_1391 [Micractinium conductrix]|uniref:Uncharacterized protein n=1 Tax=Micractinium conductrix TaxID=554055 RepID=A0A2P6VMK3_9CHLO|nr:hypothetical protein C2E20_1391 [Micractinium conductrix]|eukprot:PSC75313.1 hypothetical protein C2E20_1391 [Micractinium conductrix]